MHDVRAIGVVPGGVAGVQRAGGMVAGDWVFLTGHLAGDLVGGLDPRATEPAGLPTHAGRQSRREGEVILGRLAALLEEAGSDLAHAVRLDQYYPTWRAVDPYHQARKAMFGSYIPPSTSVLMDETLIAGATMDVSLMAVRKDGGRKPVRAQPKDVPVPEFSGFVPAISVGDYVFVAGQMANDASMDRLDPRATKPAVALWNGTEIRLQTDFLIRHRLKPALEAAGSSLGNAIKAQVYLSDIADAADFLDVWNAHFGANPCALSIVPTSGFGFSNGIIEINILGVRDDGAIRKEIIAEDLPRGAAFGPAAVRAGDLLCLSALVAADDSGTMVPPALISQLRYSGGGAARQMEAILDMAERVCAAGGTSLDRVVRAHHFLTDLHDYPAMLLAWAGRLGDRPLPCGAIGVPGPMPVPGCTTMMDMWAFV